MLDNEYVMEASDDIEDLTEAAKGFKKATGKFKKSSKSVIKAAKGNIFEFPVFVAKSVPLDYATATTSLLEQVYASYLQMAISINPVIDDDMARKGAQFDHLRSDTNKYLECVDPTEMPYAYDACHAVYTENGIITEFNLVNIEDSMAKIINEAVDHQPLSEFDHFFKESAYSGDGAGFFDGCEFIQEAKTERLIITRPDGSKWDTGIDYKVYNQRDLEKSSTTSHGTTTATARKRQSTKPGEVDTTVTGTTRGDDTRTDKASQYDVDRANAESLQAAWEKALDILDRDEKSKDSAKMRDKIDKEINKLQKEIDNYDDDHDRKVNLDNASLDKLKSEKEKSDKEIEKLKYDTRSAKNKADWEEEDRDKKKDLLDKEVEKASKDIEKLNVDIEKSKRQADWDKEDRELDRMKKMNDARVKTPQFLDETKIQKLNTMKPLMMSVDLNVVDKNGSLSRPVSYVVGVKCHIRLIDSDILPEVAAYPLKEMNKNLRKVKWRAGELKFGRDILWKKTAKKQTAADSRDPKRKWYRRLYELAHMSGDGTAAASVKNGKSPWANWWHDKLTGGNNKDVGHGLIPNATIVMAKSDVDNIKREKGIDLLNGKKAAKFCKELFLIGLIVIDNDAESVKVMLPDLHDDYEVQSIAAINKQLATLDTAGSKTRDIMKLLG